MRRFFRMLPLLFVSLSFMSCVDYVQSIGYKNGKYQLYYKITLSKMMFSLAEADPEDLFREIESDMSDLPPGANYRRVDTDLEAGIELSAEINPKTADEDDRKMLPVSEGNRMYLPFLPGSEDVMPGDLSDITESDDDMTSAMAKAMLSSAKCRILLSKKMLPAVGTVYFEGLGGQDCSLPVFDYGESFCIEIPFILLAEKGKYKFDRVVVSLP
ncbi:MAG: hypothetical protein II837_01330 [Treponema sp.]|nr:hypothetical protein [Treponema sp.]